MAALHLSATFQLLILLLLFWAVFCASSFLVALKPCQVLPGIIDAYAAVLHSMLDVFLSIERRRYYWHQLTRHNGMDGKMLLISLRYNLECTIRTPKFLRLPSVCIGQVLIYPAGFNIPPNWTKSRNNLVQDVTQGTEP
ncbi:hypothetical protein T12_14402 [Trichinella patagoniensis]|uniref:Uncharacterized protein n=1 Tax=Trichinella patagoniensis TaxID=990121 RepID=A0A0V0ZQ24_9BILA|nr:hypothetical protein T12_14402 [Trichinella patagoniensis]